MIRSFLFSPGDDEKKIGKASGIGADSVILDLEDSVAESRKPIARDLVSEFLLSEKKSNVFDVTKLSIFLSSKVF